MGPGLVICADDYAISEGTSAVILELLAQHQINATSCLVETAAWETCSGPLRKLAEVEPGIAIGLHLNLTEVLPHCAAPEAVKPVGWWLMRSGLPNDERGMHEALGSFRAQWLRFIEFFGTAPDFIDGHQHVHLFTPARQALFRLVRETRFMGSLRQCRTSSRRWISQRILFDPLGEKFARHAQALGVSVNTRFGGLRRFRRSEDIESIWREDLKSIGEDGLLIAHPGTAGSPAGADSIDRCRVQEAAAFSDGRFRCLLQGLNIALAVNARRSDPEMSRPALDYPRSIAIQFNRCQRDP